MYVMRSRPFNICQHVALYYNAPFLLWCNCTQIIKHEYFLFTRSFLLKNESEKFIACYIFGVRDFEVKTWNFFHIYSLLPIFLSLFFSLLGNIACDFIYGTVKRTSIEQVSYRIQISINVLLKAVTFYF